MLSIARIGSDASYYYKTEDYYLADKGQGGGSLSDELSLKGEVRKMIWKTPSLVLTETVQSWLSRQEQTAIVLV